MRPSQLLGFVLLALLIVNLVLVSHAKSSRHQQNRTKHILTYVTSALGLTDLCVATEARYTRHPAISDPISPFMDHPGAIEHFPSGSFWVPVPYKRIRVTSD